MAEVEMPVVKLGNQGLEVNQKQANLWVFFFFGQLPPGMDYGYSV